MSRIIKSEREILNRIYSEDAKALKTTAASSPQEPVTNDSDSVYGKDILIDLSDENDFVIPAEPTADKERILTSLVSNVYTAKIDDTFNNPKILTLTFVRPVLTSSLGINSGPGGTFSNVKIIAYQGDFEYTLVDESLDNTDLQIKLFNLAPVKFSSLRIEFHTDNVVSLGLIGIFKYTDTASRLQALKTSDGTVVNIEATDSGNLKTSDAESGLAIAEGLVKNTSFIHKFGEAADIDTGNDFADIWDGCGPLESGKIANYTFSTTNDIDSISSTEVADTQVIEVQGLDIDYKLVLQDVTLDGRNSVTLTTPLIRVFRMKNIGDTDITGEVYLRTNGSTITNGVPDDITSVRAVINDGNNQTLMAIYTIPAGKTGYMRDWYAALSRSRTTVSTVKLRARPFGQVFQLKHISAITSAGTSSLQHIYTEPEKFTEKTDIMISANASINSSSVSAGFDIVLKDNIV